MQVTSTSADRSQVVLDVQLPPDQVVKAVDEAVRHLARRTRVPGFRPGKAPRSMLERALGVQRGVPGGPGPDPRRRPRAPVRAHRARGAARAGHRCARPSQRAGVDGVQRDRRRLLPGHGGRAAAGQARRLRQLPLHARRSTSRTTPRSTRSSSSCATSRRQLVAVEGRPAEKGDFAVIAFEGRLDGKPVEGAASERLPLVIGNERMIPGLRGQPDRPRRGRGEDLHGPLPRRLRRGGACRQGRRVHGAHPRASRAPPAARR